MQACSLVARFSVQRYEVRMVVEYENEAVRIVHLQGLRVGPNFPRGLEGASAYKQIPGRKVEQIIFHHSAGGFYDGAKAVERIADYAIAPPIYARDEKGLVLLTPKGKRKLAGGGRGWPGVPYTFVIPARPASEDGKLVLYRVWDDEWQTWHTGGVHNAHGVGVCMAGWYASRHDLLAEHAWARPTEEAMICAEHLVDYLADRYRLLLSADTLASHAELGKPACPGDFVENWVREKRGELPLRQIEQAREDARPLTTPKQIQLALVELGYNPGEVDGFWGPFTANALRAFQTSEGIRADGIFGPISRLVMRQALAR